MRMRIMPSLNDCMDKILTLIKTKHHEKELTDEVLFKKGLFAVIELGECLDVVKKNGVKGLRDNKELAEHVAEEYIDAMFYILDSYGLLYREGLVPSADDMFLYKWNKNMGRERGYGRPKC